MKSTHLPEAVRRQHFENATNHLQQARRERHHYRAQCKDAEAVWDTHIKSQEPVKSMHYLYDFAQQVHLPFHCQQTGPAYFKTAI